MSARLNKARRNRAGEQRPKNADGHRAIPKRARTISLLCKCTGCRCTRSVELPIGTAKVTRREATCKPCRGRKGPAGQSQGAQHTRTDGRPHLRIRRDRKDTAA